MISLLNLPYILFPNCDQYYHYFDFSRFFEFYKEFKVQFNFNIAKAFYDFLKK